MHYSGVEEVCVGGEEHFVFGVGVDGVGHGGRSIFVPMVRFELTASELQCPYVCRDSETAWPSQAHWQIPISLGNVTDNDAFRQL